MLWRHLCLVRAWSAAGLIGFSLVGAAAHARAASDDDSTPRPNPPATETVSVLNARKAGDLAVEVRGAGQDRVKVTLKNTSDRRLNVVLPPGLVAASAPGQRGGGGGLQSMGLGSVSNRPGGFGEFRAAAGNEPGFRSVAATGSAKAAPAVAVPVGQSVDLSLPSVCLNYGLASPSGRDKLELMDVAEYSTDARVQKALRSLATYGTSQGTAQAAMWRVCNNLPFEVMAAQGGKVMNTAEIALAARFVEALDTSASSDLVDPAYLQEGRLFVRVIGDGALAKDAERLASEIDGLRLMGLPARAVSGTDDHRAGAPAMHLNVVLTGSSAGETRARVAVSQADLATGQWVPMGRTTLVEGSNVSVLDGPTLAKALDRAVASTFVTVKPARRAVGTTTFQVQNRLPFTLAKVTVKAGTSSGAPSVELPAVGVAPGRSGLVPVQSPQATVERVELNGL